jgi:hypothetical protein
MENGFDKQNSLLTAARSLTIILKLVPSSNQNFMAKSYTNAKSLTYGQNK